MNGHIDLSDDHLVIDFPYDADQVAEIKKITGAKWDKVNRVWRAPMTSLTAVREFATRHNFTTSPDVDTFTLPAQPATVTRTGLSLDGEYVLIDFPYDPVKVRMVKQIPGVTWSAKTKGWRAPLASLSTAISWATKFDLPVPDELSEFASRQEEQASEMIAASRATDADVVIPGFQGDPFPYQRAGIAHAAKSRRCFIADDMGLGKTAQAIGALELADGERESYPAVVVCPPKLVLNWAKEYEKWLPHRKVATILDRKKMPEDYDVVVVGWSNISYWADQLVKHKSYIFDESHSAKNPQAQRTKAAVKLTKTAPKDAMILMLTGTPITNRPAEYAPQLQILGKLDKFGGLYGYYRTYCAAFKDRWGHWHLDGASNLDQLNDRLRAEGLYIRRTKEQVLTELPPVLHDKVVVEGDGAAMREYRKAEADIVAYLVERARRLAEEMGMSPGSAAVRAKMAAESNEHLVRISVLRRLAARAKMEAVHEFVGGHLEQGMKVVIAAHHREIVEELSHKYGGLRIMGGQDAASVEAVKSRFQGESCEDAPVIVLSIQAAKEGHTLTASQNVLFVELPWTWADVAQTFSRCHRIGQTGSVTSTYLLCSGTVDEEIFGLLERKREVVRAAVEGGESGTVDVGKEIVGKFLQLGLDNLE